VLSEYFGGSFVVRLELIGLLRPGRLRGTGMGRVLKEIADGMGSWCHGGLRGLGKAALTFVSRNGLEKRA